MTTNHAYRISRRQFLAGSLASAAPLALGLHANASGDGGAAAPDDAGPAHLLPVGYWAGSPHVADLHAVEHAMSPDLDGSEPRAAHDVGVIGADRLHAGDADLVRTGVRVTVVGLAESPRSLIGSPLDRLVAHVHFPASAGDAHRTTAVPVWCCDKRPVANMSRGVGMTVPIDPRTGMHMSVEHVNGPRAPLGRVLERLVTGREGPGTGSSGHARLDPGRAGGTAKLRRGIYFIASPTEGAPPPAWGSHEFRPFGPAGARTLVRRGPLGYEAPDFDYLVLIVEPAA